MYTYFISFTCLRTSCWVFTMVSSSCWEIWRKNKNEQPAQWCTFYRNIQHSSLSFLPLLASGQLPRAHLHISKLTCPWCPGIPAPLLEISSVKEETYFLCSSRIISNCRFSCLISRWIRFCPSKTCLSSRSPTLSNISSAEMEITN